MQIDYYPDTDSLFIKLKPGVEAEGAEVAQGIVLHYTPEGEVTAIDIDSRASALVDVSALVVNGIPVEGEAAEWIREVERERVHARLEEQVRKAFSDSLAAYKEEVERQRAHQAERPQ